MFTLSVISCYFLIFTQRTTTYVRCISNASFLFSTSPQSGITSRCAHESVTEPPVSPSASMCALFSVCHLRTYCFHSHSATFREQESLACQIHPRSDESSRGKKNKKGYILEFKDFFYNVEGMCFLMVLLFLGAI